MITLRMLQTRSTQGTGISAKKHRREAKHGCMEEQQLAYLHQTVCLLNLTFSIYPLQGNLDNRVFQPPASIKEAMKLGGD